MRWTIDIVSDFAVVGYNPENADMDRPNGEIVGEIFYLRATNDRGERRAWGSFRNLMDAEQAQQTAPPVILWDEVQPEYGSQAYVEDGGEEEMMAWEARMQEAENYGFDTRYMRF